MLERTIACAFLPAFLAAADPLHAQDAAEAPPASALPAAEGLALTEGEPDPCASTVTHGELKLCWAREVDYANEEMHHAVEALITRLPRDSAGAFRKAQRRWVEFRDAQVSVLFRERLHDAERFTCALIAQRQLTRARTRQLRELLRAMEGDLCPL